MGQPQGVTVKEVQERIRNRDFIQGIASHIAAALINSYLRWNTDGLQAAYDISAVEAAQVVKELAAIRGKVDPLGDWK